MLLISIGLIATVLIAQQASALTHIESLNSDKSPQVKQAFITRVNQSTLTSSSTTPVVLTLPNSADFVIIIRNSSLQVNNDSKIECNPLKVGVRSDKRWYGSDIKLYKPFVQYRFTPDENNLEYMIMELKPNKDFVIFYLHNDDCKIGGSLVDITGVVSYTPLNDSSCPTQHNLTVFILNRTVCIDQSVHPIIKKRLLSMIPGTRFDLQNFTTPSAITNVTKGSPWIIAWITVPFVILIFVIGAIVIKLFPGRKKHKRRKTSIELQEMKPLLSPLTGKEKVKKLRKSFIELKGILNKSFKSFEFSDSFSESIKSAVQTRNDNVNQIKKFLKDNLSEGKQETLWIKEALNICDEVVESKVTLVFLGRLNSGKSTLITRLIENKFSLPTGENPTTSRITRLVYSDRCYIKKVKIKEFNDSQKLQSCEEEDRNEKELKWNENLQQYELGNNEELKEYFNIDRRINENEEYKTTIIEIGLKIDNLKKMILIDFPGLEENQELSEMDLETLEVLKPTIICYMYTYSEGFTMVDAKCCDKISKSLVSDIRNDVQYILVANKFDLSFGNEYDFTEVDIFERREEYLDRFQNEENKLIRYLCKFKDSNADICIQYSDQIKIEKQKWFKFDKDRLLPALPMSLKKGVDDDNSEFYSSLFRKFERDIIMKIINQSRAILINISEYVGAAAISKKVKMNLWYKLKSLSMDEQLLRLIDSLQQDNRNVLFSGGQYQVFGREFLSGQVHITKVTCDQSDPHKLRIFEERNGKVCRNRSGSSSVVYECDDDDKSTIYLIDKEMPHQKFSDFWSSNIDKRDWIEILLRFVVTEYHYLGEFKPNFCVNNLFVDEDMEIICANGSFLNDSPPTFDINEQNSHDLDNSGISEEFSSLFKFMNSFRILIKLISGESPTQIYSDRISSMLENMQTCCSSLQRNSLFYHHWDLIIKIFKMTIETEEPLNEVQDLTPICIPPPTARSGSELDNLTFDGSWIWIFRPRNEERVTWKSLEKDVVRSRNIRLPPEMFGIIVFIKVKRVRVCSQEELQIQLVAPCEQDANIQLPLCLTIQVDIELPSYANRTNLYRSHWTNLYSSHKHRFRIEEFSETKNAKPDNFFIPFRKKYIKPNRNLKLTCKFCH